MQSIYIYVYSNVSMKKSVERRKNLKIPFDVVYGCERINILKVDKLEKGPKPLCAHTHIQNDSVCCCCFCCCWKMWFFASNHLFNNVSTLFLYIYTFFPCTQQKIIITMEIVVWNKQKSHNKRKSKQQY